MKHPNAQRRLIAYPFAFQSPETGLGLGAAATVNFRAYKKDTISPYSQISAGMAWTEKNQTILSLPFALYLSGRKHTINGEFTYSDFFFNYYGTGAGNNLGIKERYEVIFPLFRINYLYRFSKNWYAGARWWLENYRIQSFESNPELLLPSPGRTGGMTSGPGLVALFDTRDNIYYSRDGLYLELVFHDQRNVWGSDFKYQRYRFDFRHFKQLSHHWSLGNQLFGDFIHGNAPFNQMPGIGAGRRGRGFYEGRYRDNNLLFYQGELRGIDNGPWGITFFWSYAILANHPMNFTMANDHGAAGLGLRYAFDQQNRTNLRLDLAFPIASGSYIYEPSEVAKIYFTVNESF